jgi:type II secretory ATPase GspE/PulE/Tfp pilus assembly ATPase PilB-like protein
LAGADVSELKALAFDEARQVRPLATQALHRVQAHDTTLEEVARVVGQV